MLRRLPSTWSRSFDIFMHKADSLRFLTQLIATPCISCLYNRRLIVISSFLSQ